MTTRILRTKGDIKSLVTFLDGRKLPLTVTVTQGKVRTIEQNRLQRLWCNEIAEQLGDRTAEEVRGQCKLTMGVPILRAENDRFCERYDALVRPLPYETKLGFMMEPIDFPVTRLMTVWQNVRYLDHMHQHYSQMGIVLTDPSPEFARDVKTANAKREMIVEEME
jgi:hypothetical protein